MTQTRNITIRDVARQARISPTVVSQVINQTAGAHVAAQTREHVIRVAREMGYERSLLARSIKTPLRQLGIAVGQMEQPQYVDASEVFVGIREACHDRGYYPVIQQMPTQLGQRDCTEAVDKMTELFQSKLINGFIIDKPSFLTPAIRELNHRGVLLVTVNGQSTGRDAPDRGEPVPSVVVDNDLGGRLAVGHLVALGHRRIAMVSRDNNPVQRHRMYQAVQLELAARATLTEAGLSADDMTIAAGDPLDRELTEATVDRLLDEQPRPTALFVVDDSMAVMAMNVIRRRGLRVPEDVSVIGYGDWPVAVRMSEPQLTSVHAPLRKNGQRAADMLMALIEGKSLPQPQIILPAKLIVRQSTSTCP